MFLIPCPWCGERDESEFSCAGEAHIDRPLDPDALNEEQWSDYLFNRANPKGWHREQWQHSSGCRRFFNMIRHTVTYEIKTVYQIGERPPLPGEEPSAPNKEPSAANEKPSATSKKPSDKNGEQK